MLCQINWWSVKCSPGMKSPCQRMIVVYKVRIAPIYKPFRPFGKGITPVGDWIPSRGWFFSVDSPRPNFSAWQSWTRGIF